MVRFSATMQSLSDFKQALILLVVFVKVLFWCIICLQHVGRTLKNWEVCGEFEGLIVHALNHISKMLEVVYVGQMISSYAT